MPPGAESAWLGLFCKRGLHTGLGLCATEAYTVQASFAKETQPHREQMNHLKKVSFEKTPRFIISKFRESTIHCHLICLREHIVGFFLQKRPTKQGLFRKTARKLSSRRSQPFRELTILLHYCRPPSKDAKKTRLQKRPTKQGLFGKTARKLLCRRSLAI